MSCTSISSDSVILASSNGSNSSTPSEVEVTLLDRCLPMGGLLDWAALVWLLVEPPNILSHNKGAADGVSPLPIDSPEVDNRGMPINPENGSMGSSYDMSIKSSSSGPPPAVVCNGGSCKVEVVASSVSCVVVGVPCVPGDSIIDHDYERSKQERLMLLCRRSIALPVGRGMLTLGTHNMLSAEQLLIPNIVLNGRVPPAMGTLALDMSSCPANFRVWPEFHNGVAAGLRLPHASADKNEKTITRTWIKFNKPVTAAAQNSGGNSNSAQTPTPSYAHGGCKWAFFVVFLVHTHLIYKNLHTLLPIVLMSLGLRGYLSALTT